MPDRIPLDMNLLIPQHPPVLVIDCIVKSGELFTTSRFCIPENHIFCSQGIFTEAGMIENIAQTAAAHDGVQYFRKSLPIPLGFIGAVKKMDFFFLPPVGTIIETTIEIEHQVFQATIIKGEIYIQEKLVARGWLKVFSQAD